MTTDLVYLVTFPNPKFSEKTTSYLPIEQAQPQEKRK